MQEKKIIIEVWQAVKKEENVTFLNFVIFVIFPIFNLLWRPFPF